jgi:hypothetical protein
MSLNQAVTGIIVSVMELLLLLVIIPPRIRIRIMAPEYVSKIPVTKFALPLGKKNKIEQCAGS